MVVQVLSGPLNSTEILTSHSRVLKSTADRFELVTDARGREYQIKAWKRDWKINLIEQDNPHWDDLLDSLSQ